MSVHSRDRATAPTPTTAGRAITLRGRMYLLLCGTLLAVMALLVGRYFLESAQPPAPAAALGAIPAAVLQAVPPPAVPPPAVPPPAVPPPLDAITPLPAMRAHVAALPAPPLAPPLPFAMEASLPVSVQAPSVGIDSPLEQVGLNVDGTIEVPTNYNTAAWYRLGPTPGARGPAVLIGHVDSYNGPAVFFDLGNTRPGQNIDITRADNTVAHFRVDAIDSYPKDQFPTEAVYGRIDYAGLRLITCSGAFDEATRSYESNTVVYATLISPDAPVPHTPSP